MTSTFRNERRILGCILKGLSAAGYAVTFDDREDEEFPAVIKELTFERDGRTAWNYEEIVVRARKDGKAGWVYLIFSNGNDSLDVITDYTVNLESVLDPIICS